MKALIGPAALLLIGAGPVVPVSTTSALRGYAGRYPFEKVRGVAFLDHPVVRAAARRAAPNSMLARQVLHGEVTIPVQRSGALLVASSCQAHNCPGQNWSVVIDMDVGLAAICYYQKDLTDDARWFVGGRLVARPTDRGCDDDVKSVPAPVLAALKGR